MLKEEILRKAPGIIWEDFQVLSFSLFAPLCGTKMLLCEFFVHFVLFVVVSSERIIDQNFKDFTTKLTKLTKDAQRTELCGESFLAPRYLM